MATILLVGAVSSSSEPVAHARGLGAYPGLVKPFEPAELLDLVRHELGPEAWVSSRTTLGPFGSAKDVTECQMCDNDGGDTTRSR